MGEIFRLGARKKGTVYQYTALGSDNKLVKGSIRTLNKSDIEQILSAKQLTLISLEPAESKLILEQLFPSIYGVKQQETYSFSRQLATLVESGISLLDSLALLKRQMASRGLKKIIGNLIDDLRMGHSFSEALAKHPLVFSNIYCRTVAVSEQTGDLPNILRQLADYHENASLARKKIAGALIYPTLVIVLGLIVSGILLTTSIPAMKNMFEGMKVDLPLATRMLIAISSFISNNKFLLLAFIILIAALILWLIKNPRGREWFDGISLRLPLIGAPLHSAEVARLSRTFSVLLSAGLPLHEAMELLPQTSNNRAVRRSIIKVNHAMVRGDGLYRPMSKDHIFPPLLLQMVAVGEETNTLSSTLVVSANFYENESKEKIDQMVKFIQPAATIFIALFVGFIAMAAVLPMYSISNILK